MSFTWKKIHTEFALKLVDFRNKQIDLIAILKRVFKKSINKDESFDKNGKVERYMDPFTVFSLINKHQSTESRIKIWNEIKKEFKLTSSVPTDFDGVPTSFGLSAWYYHYSDSPLFSPDRIKNLWDVQQAAIDYINEDSQENFNTFCQSFNILKGQSLIRWKLSIGLYWMFPDKFLSLDEKTRKYISVNSKFSDEVRNMAQEITDAGEQPDANVYLDLAKKIKKEYGSDDSFSKIAHQAYIKDKKEKAKAKQEEKENAETIEVKNDESDTYTKEDFLNDVFMDENEYDELKKLLLFNKNIILQGPPGTGKTRIAKRLAWTIVGCIDNELVKVIQFHPNFTYEEFVMGYKPDGNNGFKLESGAFKDFCDQARSMDVSMKSSFIIDEINRGDINKIFGEILMSIDKDMRDNPVKLYYQKDESFTVPKNVLVIGTMNNADKSLSTIDYAMRRRFAFYSVTPKFDNKKFMSYLSNVNSQKLNNVIALIKEINNEIIKDETLGEDYCIGHSYFCNFKDSEDAESKIPNIIRYDIIPLLKEYWLENKEKFDTYKKRLLALI